MEKSDDGTFEVTGVKVGTVAINFAAHSNSKITGKCDVTVTPPAPTGIKLDKTDLSVDVGAKGNVVASVDPANADQTLDVTTSDDKTATVAQASDKKSYEVTGVKAGTANITFASHVNNKITGVTKVTVTTPAPPAPTDVKVDKTELSVEVGAKGNIVASVEPAGADQGIDVSTSDDKTATVALAADKKSYEITGVKAGTANITFASHTDNTKTTVVKVTVTAASVKSSRK